MQVFGVVGDPVEHSLSPPMHRAAYEALDMDADYSRFPVTGDVGDAIGAAAALGIDGLNVTIPHKEAVAALDAIALDDTARRIGAVNTVDVDGMTGYNTDAAGAMRALDHHGADVDGSEAVVVGAGGAARAIAHGLVDRIDRLAIVNRTVGRAEALADALPPADVETAGLDALPRLLPEADVLVNATDVGMEGDVTPVPKQHLHGDLVVFDAVYTPLETRLLREAADVGADTISGDWMLVYQGAEAFEIWTDVEAPVSAMVDGLHEALS